MRPHLFGPVAAPFDDHSVSVACAAGTCKVFSQQATLGLDVVIGPDDSWNDVLAKLPPGWHPEFVVLQLSQPIPPGLWSAPIPLVGLATEYDRLWSLYLQFILPSVDLVLAGHAGAAAFAAAGVQHVRTHDFAADWSRAVANLENEWSVLLDRAAKRSDRAPNDMLLLCAAQAVYRQHSSADSRLKADLEHAAASSNDPLLHHLLGLVRILEGDVSGALSCFG